MEQKIKLNKKLLIPMIVCIGIATILGFISASIAIRVDHKDAYYYYESAALDEKIILTNEITEFNHDPAPGPHDDYKEFRVKIKNITTDVINGVCFKILFHEPMAYKTLYTDIEVIDLEVQSEIELSLCYKFDGTIFYSFGESKLLYSFDGVNYNTAKSYEPIFVEETDDYYFVFTSNLLYTLIPFGCFAIAAIVLSVFYSLDYNRRKKEHDRIKRLLKKKEQLLLDLDEKIRNAQNEIYQSKERSYQDEMTFVDNLDGLEFEHWCGNLFADLGYFAEVTQASGDYGADLILNRNTSVQCKLYSQPVGVKSVMEVNASKGHYKTQNAMVVTNNYFTPQAKLLANELNVTLVNRNDLKDLILKAKRINIETINHFEDEIRKLKQECIRIGNLSLEEIEKIIP